MPEGKITALEVQKRNKERVNVYLDGDYAFSLNLDDAAKLRKGQQLTATDIAGLRSADDVVRAVESAARYLGHRPRSEAEVRQNLAEKDYDPAVIDLAVERLHGLSYLDDAAFAKFWVQDRETFKPAGLRALRYELRQKGVADPIIDAVLVDYDVEDAAYRAAEKKLRQLRGRSRDEFQKKLMSHLQRRGFDYDDTRRTINQLIEDLETNEPDFFNET